MGYFFYAVSFFFLVTATVFYATRSLWIVHAPPIPYLTAPGPIPDWLFSLIETLKSHPPVSWILGTQRYVRLPTTPALNGGSFQSDLEAGFSSSNFDLAQNVEGGDSRRGLDEDAKRDVQRIMKSRGLGFDEARRLYMEERFGRENIGADGRPLDRKAVMFDRL
ncbi:hypothetical protein AAFC00_003397 [Neodothiora populina]|uniref:Uncharacterized protein n=1 Tax=Neodothiora populina TaxID=2781224 RepID=A0ABR3PE16_9PEZI